jgi:hypothetical protein
MNDPNRILQKTATSGSLRANFARATARQTSPAYQPQTLSSNLMHKATTYAPSAYPQPSTSAYVSSLQQRNLSSQKVITLPVPSVEHLGGRPSYAAQGLQNATSANLANQIQWRSSSRVTTPRQSYPALAIGSSSTTGAAMAAQRSNFQPTLSYR